MDEKVKRILDEKGFSEDLIEYVIEEKMKRYERLKSMVEMEMKASLIEAVTDLENSIVNAIEKYLKLKYPERYATTRVLQNVNDNEELKKELDELKKMLMK